MKEKLQGLLLRESLKNERVLQNLEITKTETWEVDNAADYQPKVWTAIYFEGEAKKSQEIARKLSLSLKPRWYVNFSVEDKVYIIFPEKVFRYQKGDQERREEAKDYARSLDIPESQLDWTE